MGGQCETGWVIADSQGCKVPTAMRIRVSGQNTRGLSTNFDPRVVTFFQGFLDLDVIALDVRE